MSEVNEMSAGSRGSRGYKFRQSFERWAEKDGRLRTIRRTNGDYLDASARWAWEGWQAAALTDKERDETIEKLEVSKGALTRIAHILIQQIGEFRKELLNQRMANALTDEERAAIEKVIGRELDAEWYGGPEPERVATLRRLLERLG